MSESVCLQCGKDLEYDWAPCPECGWKAPETWETPEEEEAVSQGLLSKPRPWIKFTTWIVLIAALGGLILFLLRL